MLVLIGLVLIIFQIGLKWFKKYTSEEQKKSTQTQARKILDNLEVQKIILQQADSLETIHKGYEMIFQEIEKLKGLKQNYPELSDQDLEELGGSYHRSRDEACFRFYEREVTRILAEAETSRDPQIKKIHADKALKIVCQARQELDEKHQVWLDRKKNEIEQYLA